MTKAKSPRFVPRVGTDFEGYTLLAGAVARSKKKGLECTLTREWVIERITQGCCEVTGIRFVKGKGYGPSSYSATIDRIDPVKGYTPDNCRMVIWAFNCFKGRMTDPEVFAIARRLAKVNPHEWLDILDEH
jgi:hypothetical protein